MKELIQKLMNGEHLTQEEAIEAMNLLMSGEATPSQIAGFLIAMRMKGETVDEITGFATAMRAKANRVYLKADAIDIVGTGGDGANTFNISTASAFVTAAAGMPVAKHGNRAASSKCGTADVLEALGANITLTPEKAAECIEKVGICFMFAQSYHSAMKHVAGTRRELGVRTVFNILGPLSNPAFVRYQLLGVPAKTYLLPLAEVLRGLGVKHAMVVHSEDGLDEISIAAPTSVCELKDGHITSYTIAPEDFGLQRGSMSDLRGGSASENAEILKNIFQGLSGPKRDVVLMNAGAALYTAEKATSIAEGIEMAAKVIDRGAALQTLNQFIVVSNAN